MSAVATRSTQSELARPSQPQQQTFSSSNAQGASTPQHPSVSAASSPAAVPSPGRFQHPRMEEIVRRKAANEFGADRAWVAVLNGSALFATLVLGGWLYSLFTWLEGVFGHDFSSIIHPSWILNAGRLVFCSNLYFALRPVIPFMREIDDFDDIALSKSQRALLGLPPSQTDLASTDYVTPPRYRRSSPGGRLPTPQSDATNRAAYSGSPLSTSRYTVGFSPTPQHGSATLRRRFSGSPFSPSSPLSSIAFTRQKTGQDSTYNQDFTESTRSLLAGDVSTNSLQNSMRRSHSMRDWSRAGQDPGTPSPSAKEKSKINIQPGVNYKWLYDKGLRVGRNGNVEYDR